MDNVTCLGCGCACDDITIRIDSARIIAADRACALGVAWFGDGHAPASARVGGADSTRDAALDAAAALLSTASRPMVFVAPDLSCEAQREAVAIADHLGAALDSVTSSTAMASIVAGQESGRATASLGEIRHRADVIVYWGVDPDERYPRFIERYVPAEGLRVSRRHVIAVDVGERRGPKAADVRLRVAAGDEVAVLTTLTAAVGRQGGVTSHSGDPLDALASRLASATYSAIVCDAEGGGDLSGVSRASALIGLAHAANGPSRAALVSLRGGGNRSGADAVMTSQTGYPFAVDYARGYPRYRPADGGAVARLSRGEVDALLVVGDIARIPKDLRASMAHVPLVTIGPRATEQALANARVVVDTGVAGVHDEGTALRLDDVPLPLRRVLDGPPETAATIRALGARLRKADAVGASARRIGRDTRDTRASQGTSPGSSG